MDDTSQNAWGRPVQVVVDNAGSLLISDDAAGAIYSLTYAPVAVSAASGVAVLSPESIGSIFGANLSTQTGGADSADWPLSLAGVQLTVQDKTGKARPAPLAYVSSTQINFEVPAGTATGNATLMLQRDSGTQSLGAVLIRPNAPALFSANGSGAGVAAATAVRLVLPSNVQSRVPVFTCDRAGICKAVPIALGVDTPTYLSLYGTGIRGRSSAGASVTIGDVSVPVWYIGPQGTYPGLDQVNVALPPSLRGAGVLDVSVTVSGQSTNTVQIAIE